MSRWRLAVLAIFTFLAHSQSAFTANTYYVAPTTSGTPNGSFASPFTSITTAISTAVAGDTIYLRGGTYNLTAPIAISKAGTAANLYHLFSFPGETPILDFNGEGSGQQGIQLKSNYWHIKGLTIQKAHDNGLFISGSNNIAELLTVRQNQDSGVQISTSNGSTPSNNLVLNTDSYFNYDPAGHGQNADGFAVKFRGLGTGNVVSGARAWNNSDDGMDFWQGEHGVTVTNTWSFHNGFNLFGDTAFAGNGEGIKLGKDSGTHLIENMLIWGNNDNGVDINGNATESGGVVTPAVIPHGVQAFNITSAYNANRNYRYDENPTTTTPPSNHILRNNVSYSGTVTINAGNTTDHNTFAGPGGSPPGLGATAADFLSTADPFSNGSVANPIGSGAAVAPRQSDGSLPLIDFLRLAPGSHLIGAGVDVGLPYSGAAPDLGWYQTQTTAPPVIHGDYNGDSMVDAADYALWRKYVNTQTMLPNDLSPGVNAHDYNVWRTYFGNPAGGGVGTGFVAVPEPGAAFSLALVAVFLATSRAARRMFTAI